MTNGCTIMFMAMDSNSAIEQIVQLGLSANAATVYLDLLGAGISTVVVIAKRSKIPRASVYRALDELISIDLVRIDGQNASQYKAQDYHHLEAILKTKNEELSRLQSGLPELFGYLLNVSGPGSTTTSVKYYEGIKGLEQVTLNTLNTKGIFRILEIDTLSAFLDQDFAEYIRRESCKRKVLVHKVTNKRKFEDFTKVENYIGKWLEVRYIEPRKLPINVEIAIYNDTVVLYDYRKDPFCVEIRNEALASMQRGMFDFIWKSSKKMKLHGQFGAASLN